MSISDTGTDPSLGFTVYFLLFQGFFCPTGSTRPQPCPNGYYGNSSHVKRSEDCAPCPAGEFCAGFGLTKPTGLCDAGFYCKGKAFTSVMFMDPFLYCSMELPMFYILILCIVTVCV